jgi:hypothetical protein
MTRKRILRKRFRVLLLAAIVAAVVVPLGFALSPDTSSPLPAAASSRVGIVAFTTVATPITVSAATAAERPSGFAVSDAAKLFFVGTIFLGLAAAVRRAV